MGTRDRSLVERTAWCTWGLQEANGLPHPVFRVREAKMGGIRKTFHELQGPVRTSDPRRRGLCHHPWVCSSSSLLRANSPDVTSESVGGTDETKRQAVKKNSLNANT